MKAKFIRYVLTGLQVAIVVVWVILGFGNDGLDLRKFNILPIPVLSDVISFGIMAGLIYGVQKVKVKLGVGEDFS